MSSLRSEDEYGIDSEIAADAFEDVFLPESDGGDGDADSLVMDVPVMSGGNGA
jgi:hypothetical protein